MKKRILSAVFGTVFAFTSFQNMTINAQSEVIYGDCNADSKVNIFDTIRLKQHLLSGDKLSGDVLLSADVNDSLGITGEDYSVLVSDLLLKSSLPAEKTAKGWCTENEEVYFLNAGNKLTGENNIFGTNYNFLADGRFKTGLYENEGDIYFSDDFGYNQSGWKTIADSRYYFEPVNNKAHKGNSIINGGHYYFDEQGILKTDWQNLPTIVDTSKSLYTYSEMENDINELVNQYPGVLRVNALAQTYDGRNIYDVIFGNPDASKKVIIHASCHGREYMTSMLVMNQLEYYLKLYYMGTYAGRTYEEIFGDVCFHVIPMLNPDGVSISQFGADAINNLDMRAALYGMYNFDRANGITNYDAPTYFRKWKANGRGVDINRNFASYWTSEREIRQPGSHGYPGEHAVSEIETQTVQNLVKSLSGLEMVISYHSSGSYIYWAYGQRGEFRNKSSQMATVVSKSTGYYLLGTDNYDSGCSNWVAGEGIVAQTIEIGTGDSPLVISEYESIWGKNRLVWIAVANKLTS
ncbi:MAG: hypothetical protein IJP18_01640 [Oscillospiraceae bacterium]|nr:hypothetical protein [Oscillospiraceae bacterium]